MPILERMTLRDARVEASRRGQAEGWPRCYYWNAIWWRLYARESAVPHEQLRYSRNQMALYRDIKLRPEHYANPRRPHGMSDWLWSGLASNG